jgi:hypothetical protein
VLAIVEAGRVADRRPLERCEPPALVNRDGVRLGPLPTRALGRRNRPGRRRC